MTKHQYHAARRLIRDNGRSAYEWLAHQYGWDLINDLRDMENAQDWLTERADIIRWCQREGVSCNPRQTGRMSA